MAAFRMPEVNFDWLANLPSVAEDTRLRFGRREALADLDTSDPESLRAAAVKLAKLGGLKELELSGRLHHTALEREQLAQRKASDEAYNKNIAPILAAKLFGQGPGGAPNTSEPGTTGIITADPEPGMGAAPAQPDPRQPAWPPSPLAPRSEAPLPPSPPTAQGPTAPSPSDAIIDAAQRGPGGVLPGPQYAQTGGVPQGAPPPPAPQVTPQSGWASGAQLGTALPGPQPQVDPQVKRVVDMPPGPERMRAVSGLLAGIKGGPSTGPQVGMLRDIFKSDMDKLAWSQDVKNWQMDNFDRRVRGERTLGFSEHTLLQKTGPKTHESAIKSYEKVSDEADKAQKLHGLTLRIEEIQKNPDFVSGNAAPLYTEAVNLLGSVIDIGRSLGMKLPDPGKVLSGIEEKYIDPARRSVALGEALTSLGNQAVFAKVGSLGANFSEGDRKFTSGIFPTLSSSKWGGPIINRMLKETAAYEVAVGQQADDYMAKNEARATPYGLRKHLDAWKDANPLYQSKDGKLTPDGEAIRELYEGKGVTPPAPQGAPAAPTAPAPAAPAAPKQYLPGEIFYKGGQPFMYDKDYNIVPGQAPGGQL